MPKRDVTVLVVPEKDFLVDPHKVVEAARQFDRVEIVNENNKIVMVVSGQNEAIDFGDDD